MVNEGQIVFANLTFRNKKGVCITVEKCVISRDYNKELKTLYSKVEDESVLRKYGIKEDVTLIKVLILQDLGMKNKDNSYLTVSESETDERQDNGSFQ